MEEMKGFAAKFKVDLMEHVVTSIQRAVKNSLPVAEVFQFKNSPFIVIINEDEFDTNLSHIHKYYVDNHIHELSPRVRQLQETIKQKLNEKKIPKKCGPKNSNP